MEWRAQKKITNQVLVSKIFSHIFTSKSGEDSLILTKEWPFCS